MYKRHGYISAKGVKYLLYKPNYIFDNHLHKDDSLFISYNNQIKPIEYDDGFDWYEGYDEVLSGSMIVDFVKAASKYSDYDVREIQAEIARKRVFYYERNPEQVHTEIKFKLPLHGLMSDALRDDLSSESPGGLSKEFGRCLPYRGGDFWLGGVAEKKPFFDHCFCVPVTHTSEQIKQDAIRIYRDLARTDLTAKVKEYAEKMDLQPGIIRINERRTDLGRCSANKNLSFSWRLIMLEDDVIDYVIVRALAHTKCPYRSPAYWALVKNILPDFKEPQHRLQHLLELLKTADWI
jgi:hypothetical protein